MKQEKNIIAAFRKKKQIEEDDEQTKDDGKTDIDWIYERKDEIKKLKDMVNMLKLRKIGNLKNKLAQNR